MLLMRGIVEVESDNESNDESDDEPDDESDDESDGDAFGAMTLTDDFLGAMTF